MVTSVKLPKSVAIHNSRLAFFHYFVYGCTFVLLFWYKFTIGHEAYSPIPIHVSTGIRWEESETIQAMENFFEDYPILEQVCEQAPSTNWTGVERWGFAWPRRVSCTNLCTLSSVIDHSTWDTVRKMPNLAADTLLSNCWADFRHFGGKRRYTALQFMQSYGEQDVIISTSKNDWIVDHRFRTHLNHVEAVPQARAAVLRVDYRYALLAEPGWFPLVQRHPNENLQGTNAKAQTVIVNSQKEVVRVVEPGEDIKFTVDEVVSWSTGGSGRSEGISDQLGTGAQFNLEMTCFGSQLDIEKHFGGGVIPDYGATLDKPVCTLEATVVSPYYQVAVHYVIPQEAENSSVEIISETKGFYFKCIPGHGVASAWDGNALLISLSSMLVFLALPRKFTSIIASWMLGSLSEMYRRAIIEPYDIERAAAAATTVIAANMSTFHALNHPNNKSGTGASPTTESAEAELTAIEIQKVLAEAMEHRRSDLDDREVASLACFVYEGIKRRRVRMGSGTGLGSVVGDILGFDFDLTRSVKTETMKTHDGISMDQWNRVRMEGEKITFDAVVKLFDRDRRRHFAESFFTPPHIKAALARAGNASALIPDVSENFEMIHKHISWYEFQGGHSDTGTIPHTEATESHELYNEFATDSVPRSESHASSQNALVATFEVEAPGIEPVRDTMDVEVGPTRSFCVIPSLTEETRPESSGRPTASQKRQEGGDISRPAPEETPREPIKTRGASSRCEHALTPGTCASSNDHLDDGAVSMRSWLDTHCATSRGSARIRYPGGGAERQEALPAPHTDAGARNASAAPGQKPSPPNAHLAEQSATAQVGGDWPVEMAGALREASELADEYPGLPQAALRDVAASDAARIAKPYTRY